MKSTDSYLISNLTPDQIPVEPGVYIFQNKKHKPIYIGKAKHIRNRIKQYFSLQDNRPLVPYLLKEAMYVSFLIVKSEKEALILENNLIKEHQPVYNIDLRDDKSYPYFAITKEKFPAIIITRHPKRKYMYIKGPFTEAGLLKKLVNFLLAAFPLRRCKRMGKKACLNYQMGLCPAPCEKKISSEEYHVRIREIIQIIEGKKWSRFTDYVHQEILFASEKLQFEKAAELRDVLTILPEIKKRMSVEFSSRKKDDYFLFSFHGDMVFITIAHFNEGQLKNINSLYRNVLVDDEKEVVLNALTSYYATHLIPERIGFNLPYTIDQDLLEKTVGTLVKKIKIAKSILQLLEKNQKHSIAAWLRKDDELNAILQKIDSFLGKEIRSILCVDASTFYGDHTVVGAVWWEKGGFVKKHYRRFKIKTVEGIDDFGSLREIAGRLLKRWNKGEWTIPDLLLIDGGKGQISSVRSIIGNRITIAGIVKDRKKEKGEEQLIDVNGNVLSLKDQSYALLLKRIRDEAHRFSITYNKTLRSGTVKTFLSTIKGVGSKKEKDLITFFGTLEAIQSATIEEIKEVPGINNKTADAIFQALHK